MKSSDDIKIDKLIHKIGLENGLSDSDIRQIIESQFKFTKNKLDELNTEINKSEAYNEDLAKVFYYKTLCRLYICKHRLQALIRRRNHITKIKKNEK